MKLMKGILQNTMKSKSKYEEKFNDSSMIYTEGKHSTTALL